MIRRLLPLLLALAPAAAAAEGPRVVVCVEDAAGERRGAEAVDRWLATAQVEVAEAPCPRPAPGIYVGRFLERGGRVFFRLDAAGAPSLERAVPWLTSAAAPLATLEQRSRASEFSVVVEALVAEHQLALLWGPADVEPEPAPAAQVEGPGPGFRRAGGGGAQKKAPPRRTARRGGTAPQRAGSGDGNGLAHGPPAPAPVPAPAPAGSPAAEDASAPAAATAPPPAPEAPPPPAPPTGETVAALRPDPPRLPGIEEAAAAARRPVLDFRAPEPGGIPFRVAAGGGLRLRGPGIAAPEAALEVELGAAWVRAAWQPRVEWNLGGYPIAVEGLSAEAGLRLLLLSGRLWGLRGHAGVAVDRTELTPLYRQGAAASPGWDVGPTAGASLGWMPFEGLELGLAAAAQWMPTASMTHVGELGPSARFNAVGGRLGLDVSWRR